MRKDFIKKQYAIKRSWRDRLDLLSWLGIFTIVLIAAFVLVKINKPHMRNFSAFSSSLTRFTTWIAERKNHLHQGIAKVKQLAENKTDTSEPVHFEFYTTLPNMQVTMSNPVASNDNQAVANNNTPRPTIVSTQKTSVKMLTADAIVNADELEKELAHELKQETYVIQVGIFHDTEAAEHYRKSLADAGFTASITKVALKGKTSYRVQLGPFANKNQTKIVQQRLQKKGLNGLIRKVEMT